ncbi:extracellular membrane protein, CFEM domain-containing protein [Pochonia chlamydosporia 170]|uniref:Extracellular membrane protein, CFEM domain-containing protein n=1 Tax=Pochonia chlamydosporia 170 TaxID=1380566 RepID=A0A179FKS0_METCM|nr:extracellular membrane protein, CFEM domain-containing protein [Pochonia chlamydosporia 170]OAQ65810.1 extracellular membrane protein, CFEM domain-containing protein [Pochonia chlamydosporia 170]
MGRLLPLFLGVLSTLHVLGVSAQAPPACVETCTNNVRNKPSDLKCPDANAAPCFCANPTFSAAILECSKSQCGGTPDNVYTYLSTNFCVGQPLAKPDGTAAPSTGASQTSSPTAQATTSSTSAAATTPATSSPSTTGTETTTTSASTQSTAAAETTGSSTTSSSPSSTTDSAANATSSGDAAGGSTSTGLSQAAIAGIGVGIGAAVIAVAGIVICMLLKGRKRKPNQTGDNMDISRPLPGSGRMYPERSRAYRHERDHSLEKFGNDLEITSHRYEDMVPRTQPRTLV